jgi:hypothetical protein
MVPIPDWIGSLSYRSQIVIFQIGIKAQQVIKFVGLLFLWSIETIRFKLPLKLTNLSIAQN